MQVFLFGCIKISSSDWTNKTRKSWSFVVPTLGSWNLLKKVICLEFVVGLIFIHFFILHWRMDAVLMVLLLGLRFSPVCWGKRVSWVWTASYLREKVGLIWSSHLHLQDGRRERKRKLVWQTKVGAVWDQKEKKVL